jgi:hypothetical protein
LFQSADADSAYSGVLLNGEALISCDGLPEAYEEAVALGELHSPPGASHKCNGDRAHFQFKGVSSLVPIIEPPSGGAMLYFDQFTASEG